VLPVAASQNTPFQRWEMKNRFFINTKGKIIKLKLLHIPIPYLPQHGLTKKTHFHEIGAYRGEPRGTSYL
jgi:hypothetical protein